MDNTASSRLFDEDINKECLVCYNITEKHNKVCCGICNIQMCHNCSSKLFENKRYTQCPHCQSIGVIYTS